MGKPFPCGIHVAIWVLAVLIVVGYQTVFAEEGKKPSDATPDDSLVQMNFPQEIEVKALVDYVSDRLKINILYDQELANKKVSVRAPERIPISSLMSVLESALKMKGLVIVDADTPGWKRIVTAKSLPNVAPASTAAEAIEKYGMGTAVTQAFVLKQASPEQVNELIKPFLTEAGANSVVLPQFKTLIITDYASNLLKITRWIELLDQPRPEAVFEFVTIEHVPAGSLIPQVNGMLASKARASGAGKALSPLELVEDARTNRLLLIGQPAQIEEAKQLIAAIDVPLKLTTKNYGFKNASAASIDRLMQQIVAARGGNWSYHAVVDSEQNLLIVTASAEVHEQIEEIKKGRDTPNPVIRSPVQFYKVKNIPANELLETIRSLERESDNAASKSSWSQLPTDGRTRAVRQDPISNGSSSSTTSTNTSPSGTSTTSVQTTASGGAASGNTNTATSTDSNPGSGSPQGTSSGSVRRAKGTSSSSEDGLATSELLGRAKVTADVHTNTLIVVAEPAVQRLYAELIEKLDQRRAQVLVEARFVSIDTSNDFSLGVEISGIAQNGTKKMLAFSSYGLSTTSATTGALTLIPGTGFNGTLVDPNVADVVVRALNKSSRAKTMSSPRILINDNANGQLTSVKEVPYSSVNASTTVATTTFAGFADAGTTITVTPHISDDSRLQMDVRITINTFTGSASDNLPPPRQTQEVSSQITIPDGYTAIIGGLDLSNKSYTYSGIPYLEQIPLVRELTGLTTTSRSKSAMFVFLRPIILRDDKFQGLKFLSETNLRKADIQQNFPTSQPIWIQQ